MHFDHLEDTFTSIAFCSNHIYQQRDWMYANSPMFATKRDTCCLATIYSIQKQITASSPVTGSSVKIENCVIFDSNYCSARAESAKKHRQQSIFRLKCLFWCYIIICCCGDIYSIHILVSTGLFHTTLNQIDSSHPIKYHSITDSTRPLFPYLTVLSCRKRAKSIEPKLIKSHECMCTKRQRKYFSEIDVSKPQFTPFAKHKQNHGQLAFIGLCALLYRICTPFSILHVLESMACYSI